MYSWYLIYAIQKLCYADTKTHWLLPMNRDLALESDGARTALSARPLVDIAAARTRLSPLPFPSYLLLLVAFLPLIARGADALPEVFRKAVPGSLDDLKTIERQVKSILPRLSRAVVAVQIGAASGSGVVISEDGLVLTAAHVCGETNRDVRFTFPDGSTARGKTLGLNHSMDAGMMKITSPGSWPHVEMGDLDQAHLGDWVLTLGHPGGFDPDRPMVVRLGRLIRLAPSGLQTDCTLSAGDSGGPLFDMQGKVIGIHSRISDSTAENFHVPITPYRLTWDRLLKSESWGEDRPSPRPWFGVRGVDDPAGCKLRSVEEDSPAFKGGLKVGDVVQKVNGRKVVDYATLKRFAAEAKPGDDLKVELQRGEKEMSINVKVQARPAR